jgi:hypothetical protein
VRKNQENTDVQIGKNSYMRAVYLPIVKEPAFRLTTRASKAASGGKGVLTPEIFRENL